MLTQQELDHGTGGAMSTDLITQPQQSGALADLRSQAMLASVDNIRAGLAEYGERRKAFRDWLRSQLVEGVHFGYPPGIRQSDADPIKWTAKPSLYKAGADYVVDLMGVRCEFRADIEAWKQLGEPKETFVIACYLIGKSGETIGEGRGVRRVGDKKMDANASIKMAEKSAKVDAVLNAYALADLFTQDVEDGLAGPEKHSNPQPVSVPTIVQPRGERVLASDLDSLFKGWQAVRFSAGKPGELSQFKAWVVELTGLSFADVMNATRWNLKDFNRCRDSILSEVQQ